MLDEDIRDMYAEDVDVDVSVAGWAKPTKHAMAATGHLLA